jgi:hypothetical protein
MADCTRGTEKVPSGANRLAIADNAQVERFALGRRLSPLRRQAKAQGRDQRRQCALLLERIEARHYRAVGAHVGILHPLHLDAWRRILGEPGAGRHGKRDGTNELSDF